MKNYDRYFKKMAPTIRKKIITKLICNNKFLETDKKKSLFFTCVNKYNMGFLLAFDYISSINTKTIFTASLFTNWIIYSVQTSNVIPKGKYLLFHNCLL